MTQTLREQAFDVNWREICGQRQQRRQRICGARPTRKCALGVDCCCQPTDEGCGPFTTAPLPFATRRRSGKSTDADDLLLEGATAVAMSKRAKENASLRSRWLGQLTRQLRDEQGLTLKFAAAHLGVDFGVLSRFERGETALTRDQVTGLLDAYRLHDPQERTAVLELAHQVWQARGQVDFDGVIPDQEFADVLWLESQAWQIHCYSPITLPDLLNTVDYATQTYPDTASPEQITARTRLVEQRQQVLRRTQDPPGVCVVLDESVLDQRTREMRVWRDQLDHLVGLAGLPNVRLRILSSGTVRPVVVDHGFTVFTLPALYPGPVVNIAYLGGWLLLEEHADRYLTAFDHLDRAAVDGGTFISNLNGSIKEG